jgi:hypothetical protein
VLRITLPTRADDPLFILEGRLAGEWVEELARVVHEMGPGKKCVFDIENVSYADLLGEEILIWLSRLGATFITQNAYGNDLCQRLHLSRTTAANLGLPGSPKQNCGKAQSKTSLPPPKTVRSS